MKKDPVQFYPARPFHSAPDGVLHTDGIALSRLALKFGTPLYVYSAAHVAGRYRLFTEAFSGRPHLVCYSVKANSNLSLLKLLAGLGSGFDIVSGGELERVLAVDREAAARVVFSGVGKTAAEMDLALRAGILLFNVESEQEADLLAQRAARLRKKAQVSLRVNPDIKAETHPYISTGLREHKFGVAISRARMAYRAMARSRWLDPAGISVHIGSQIRNTAPFGEALDRVAGLRSVLARDSISIRFIDAGGGLGVEYEAQSPQESFDPAKEVADYAAAVNRALGGLDVKLLLEPGRFLVAQAGALLTRVLYVKKNGSKTFVIVDAGMNDLIRPALYQAHHQILPVAPRAGSRSATVDVVGPVCESGDFFARDRSIRRLQPGDLVAVLDTGAYGMSLSSNYNTRPRPAEVLVEAGKARLIRPRESVRELLRTEEELLHGSR